MKRRLLLGVPLLVGVIAIGRPATEPPVPPAPVASQAFRWDRDALWAQLEGEFRAAQGAGCLDTTLANVRVAAITALIDSLERTAVAPDAAILDSLEARHFAAAPIIAACGHAVSAYVATTMALRSAVKRQSRNWDVATSAARQRLYRALYGSRAAVEEVVLQVPAGIAALQVGDDEPSDTPSATIAGVRVHSGDLLVSRGGYPTSALIARGSDYPGNFSHIGLVHVATDGTASVIEAQIAKGVTVSPAEAYLADKKLRIMLLRPRVDLPAMRADPLLPHRAATAIRDRALRERVGYDFAMDYDDPSRLFCSEVASTAYRDQGVTLWTGISTISRPGLRRWLAGLGVRHFATQEPSDLEYDPQLVVVAEWRDPAELFRDHVDNAVTDAMLERADAGDALDAPWPQVSVARLTRVYGWGARALGGHGPIPAGMSAGAALRVRSFTARHDALAATTRDAATRWEATAGYRPPYPVLVDLARAAVAE